MLDFILVTFWNLFYLKTIKQMYNNTMLLQSYSLASYSLSETIRLQQEMFWVRAHSVVK